MNESTNQVQTDAGQLHHGREYGTSEYRELTKPWSECTIEQKLERIHEELLGLRQQSKWQQERFRHVDEKLNRLGHHQHGHDGTVMIRTQDLESGYGHAAVLQGQRVFDPLA